MLLATLGGDIYSDFLGGGKRTFLNPYIGFRGGYARFLERNEFVVGGSVGLEIFRTDHVTVSADVRAMGFFGASESPHVGVQPALGANVAF